MSEETPKPEVEIISWEDHEKPGAGRNGGEFVLKGGGVVEKTIPPKPEVKEPINVS